ncbi:H+/Cl- antiporter ClcA [Humibacillus xanthopallidus]|uniref:H+/Cl-antiporter ClcA n=1 Tax=Humibacillus xanthopallidus TaxID=412689 RepID=A0A543PLB2_9MICO|nr:chloride channel protein [Humibacillus xanthopallidus]TQN44862.1 H+/Cl- antiporter ClcA [Humibacillus xanthopallidus]
MSEPTATDTGWRATGPYAAGAALGGLVGAGVVVTVTTVIKELLAVVSRQDAWVVIAVPVLGIAAATFVLHVIGRGDPVQTLTDRPVAPRPSRRARRRWPRYLRIPLSWRRFPSDVARADLTGDVVLSAGVEERFPWRQAPLRALAIVITVGSGAPMGTEAPAAHLGVATGAWLGQLRPGMRRLLRGAAVAGGAAGVSALMGVALVGTAFILELGRRRRVPLSPGRVVAALLGGVIGWAVNITLGLDLIRLITPTVAPDDWLQVLRASLYVGVIAGALTSVTGWAIYRVRGWSAGPTRRLVVGAGAMLLATVTLLLVADQRSAVGPGGGAILWAESPAGLAAPAGLLLLVAGLRAAATTAAVAAGGCGGVFVPFLAIGDLAGRSFAPHLGISGDLAGASGAASGIAGGYRLPWTAVAMVIGIGGPALAVTTSLACVLVATFAGIATSLGLDRLTRAASRRREEATAVVASTPS